MYDLNSTPTTLVVEEKIYLGVRERKRLKVTGLTHISSFRGLYFNALLGIVIILSQWMFNLWLYS